MATIKVCDKDVTIPDAPTPSGGSSVEWEQKVTTGTNIADITIDGQTTSVYAPAGGGGGGGVFLVTITQDPQTFENVADKTYAETLAAFNNGEVVVIRIDDGFGGWLVSIPRLEVDGFAANVTFTEVEESYVRFYQYTLKFSENGIDVAVDSYNFEKFTPID